MIKKKQRHHKKMIKKKQRHHKKKQIHPVFGFPYEQVGDTVYGYATVEDASDSENEENNKEENKENGDQKQQSKEVKKQQEQQQQNDQKLKKMIQQFNNEAEVLPLQNENKNLNLLFAPSDLSGQNNDYGNGDQFGDYHLPQFVPHNKIKSILETSANLALNGLKGLFIFGAGIIVSKALYCIYNKSESNNTGDYDDNQTVIDDNNHDNNAIDGL